MADRTGLGIMRGAERASSNILQLMLAKNKIDDEKERTKILNQVSKSNIALNELKLKDATAQAAREERMMQIIGRQGGGGGMPGGQGQSVDTGEVMPGLDWSYDSTGKMTLRPQQGMTSYQQQQEQTRQKKSETQRQGAIGWINSIKEQILDKGTITMGSGAEKPYGRGQIQEKISKKFPDVDITDPGIQGAMFSLENMSSEFRPTGKVSVKGYLGKGRANLSQNTKRFIKNVTSQEQIDKLVGNRGKAEAEDIDVDAVLEYFGQRK